MRWFLLFLSACSLFGEIQAFYLSWYEDPSSTMTIQWISDEKDLDDTVYLRDENNWTPVTGTHKTLYQFQFHHATLRNLKSDTEYAFRIGSQDAIYMFKTAPQNLSHPIRFVVGGDVYQNKKLFRKMNEAVLLQDPLFCALGGDLAYALFSRGWHLKSGGVHRWISFLSEWQKQMITPNQRVIPLLVTSGNHDIDPEHFELFFHIFAFHEKQIYRSLDFSSYLSLIFLDTDHFDPIEGKQTAWLKTALQERAKTPYLFAIYHEAAYPSYYPYDGPIPTKIRTYWCPLFEEESISAAFEHHNHTFKQTFPLKNNEKNPNGIIYFGDGSWGVLPRKTYDHWYLEKRARKNSVYVINLSEKEATVQAIDLKGASFSETNLRPR